LAITIVCATALAAPLNETRSQSTPEPAVVISIADFSQQLADVDYLIEASGFEQIKFMAQTMIKQYTKGIHTKSPAGVLLYFRDDAEVPDFLGFIPISNLDDLLDTIAGMAEVDEGEDFITIVTDDGTEMLVKQVGDNAFFSNKPEMLEDLPSNPGEFLGEMPAKYNLSAKLFGQRIPESLRQQAMAAIRDGYEQQLEQLDESAQTELQRKNLELQMKQFESWLNETENLQFGMGADKDAKMLFMDIQMTAIADSELASRFAAHHNAGSSMFKGFLLEGASLTANTCTSLSEADVKDYQKMLEQLRESATEAMQDEIDLSDEDAAMAKKALTELIEVVEKTMAGGKLDSGGVLMLENGEINFAAGALIANTAKLEGTVKDLLAFAETKLDGEMQVDLNSGSHKNVTFHQVVFDVPDDEEEMRDIVGDQITMIVGIGPDAVYFAAGSNPIALLKKAMDANGPSETELPMMQYNIYLTPILQFAAGIEGDPTVEAMAAAMAENGEDRIRMTAQQIKDGLNMRFEMQDGILSLIKVGFENMGAGGFGGEKDF
jgi:hypothetical protein